MKFTGSDDDECLKNIIVVTGRILLVEFKKAGKDYGDNLIPQEVGVPESEDLVVIDYTPIRKKPPIHN